MDEKDPEATLRNTAPDAPQPTDAARYLDLWERHLSMTAREGAPPAGGRKR
ncbi:hypothetical protein HMH01_04210 [Halovulum dunhuangense]|uniref:Uncharacterized protein n=1 Tax=Halovulum dunhuangense TaxID=1505036 RepID=A0A849KVZ9_9RHOB|nr:hypothetical protein [Halovulum dunhuangense]NNU79638.1 hypothetical protein [Halovulum dunhuangense]